MKDRRRHVVYLTRNSEYHCRLDECVAVRCRRTGRWQREHPAIRARIAGVVDGHRTLCQQEPEVGDRLVIVCDRLLITSRVVCVGRPDKTATLSYCSLAWVGTI